MSQPEFQNGMCLALFSLSATKNIRFKSPRERKKETRQENPGQAVSVLNLRFSPGVLSPSLALLGVVPTVDMSKKSALQGNGMQVWGGFRAWFSRGWLCPLLENWKHDSLESHILSDFYLPSRHQSYQTFFLK